MKGYLTSYGYMGFVARRWMLFTTESEYYEYFNTVNFKKERENI